MIASDKPPQDDRWKQKYKEPVAPDTTNLPELPEGWCWASVDQVGFVQLGRQRSPKHHAGPDMVPYLRVANVFEDRIDTRDVKEMNFTPAEQVTFGLQSGDILLNEGQSLELIGRPAMFRDEVPGCCFQNTLVRFRAAPSLDSFYALTVFLSYLHSGRFQKIAKWTTNIAHLGAQRFAGLEFPLPPIAEQRRIAEFCQGVTTHVEHLQAALDHQGERGSSLRKSILSTAFTGELVSQDPADEPGSVLLDRIQTERAASASGMSIRKRRMERVHA
jgi:type I restriction enzyme S subunit